MQTFPFGIEEERKTVALEPKYLPLSGYEVGHYTEIVHTKAVYMRDVTAIDPVWLEVLAPHFYEKTRVVRSVF